VPVRLALGNLLLHQWVKQHYLPDVVWPCLHWPVGAAISPGDPVGSLLQLLSNALGLGWGRGEGGEDGEDSSEAAEQGGGGGGDGGDAAAAVGLLALLAHLWQQDPDMAAMGLLCALLLVVATIRFSNLQAQQRQRRGF
jgi:hypothetical protein